jgi:hypothetical protein
VGESFYNQPGRVARMFLIIACPLVGVGLPACFFLFSHFPQPNAPFTTRQGIALAGFVALPIGVAMLLCALLTLPAAMRARKIFIEFNAGNYLARWQYDQSYWQAYIDGEARRLRRAALWAFWIVFVVGLFVLTMMVINMPASGLEKIRVALVILASTLVAAFTFFVVVRAYAKSRCRRLMVCGEAVIGSHAAYMGGDLAFWGYGLRALQSARFVPGTPATIEIVVGLNKVARNASRVIDTVNTLALHPTYSAGKSDTQRIPVPPGGEATARELVRKINELNLHPAPARALAPRDAPSHEAVVHSSAATAPVAHSSPSIEPSAKKKTAALPATSETLHRRARHWWRITIATAIIGISLFLAAVVVDFKLPPKHAPTVGDSLAAWGFVLVALSLIILPVALFQTFKARHRSRLRDVNPEPRK